MDELTVLARRIEADHDDLEAWQRLGELVDDPQKKRDCLNQVTRIQNKDLGLLQPIPCKQCGAFLQVISVNADRSFTTACPVCHQTTIEAGNSQPVIQGGPSGPLSMDQPAGVAWLNDRITLAAIIASNLLPIFGILFLDWSMGSVMLLYWSENVIVGLFTLLKMAFAQGQLVTDAGTSKRSPTFRIPLVASRSGDLLGKLFILPFFCVHFGLFCLGHAVFVLALFFPKDLTSRQWLDILAGLSLPILGMLLSHGLYFVRNYLGNGAYRFASINKLMGEPYARIAPLHIGLIAAGFFIATLGSPMPVVVALVLLKTGAEVTLFRKPKKKQRPHPVFER